MKSELNSQEIANAETTYFWHPEYDSDVCRAYVKAKYPDTKARVVSMVNMHRLTERSHLICLTRRGKVSPTEVYALEMGRRLPVQIDPTTLLEEVTEGKAVAVKPFITGSTEWEDGALDAGALIDRCSKDFSPAVCHYRSDDGKAHLFGS